MSADLASLLDKAIADFEKMPTAEQLLKLDQVLMMYTRGDAHAMEGMKLTYMSLVRHPWRWNR